MKQATGVAGKLFNTIGKSGVNIIAIAQGASELNISWVVKIGDLRKTLNVVQLKIVFSFGKCGTQRIFIGYWARGRKLT